MLRNITLIGLLLFFNGYLVFSQCGTTIDYNLWSPVGNTDAIWAVSPDGLTVTQSENAGASAFLSNEILYNVKISGTFRSDNGDDDYLGFVMGHRGVTPYSMYLFTWKQQEQGNNPEGYSYWDLTNRYAPINYNETTPPNSILLDSSYGVGKGWVRSFDHNFEMLYTSTNSTILIDGDTIFQLEDCFNPGKFGFYNSSQASCTYSNFSFEILADFFVEKDTICLGDSAGFNIFCDEVAPNYYDSIVWDFGDGSPLQISSNDYALKHQYLAVGTYNVNLFLRHSSSGCTATATKTIVVEDQFQASLGNDTIICPNTTVLLDVYTSPANTIVSYLWNDSSVNNTILADSTKPYHVEVYNQYGCVDRDTLILNVQSPFNIDYDTIDATCFQLANGELNILSPIGNFEYQVNSNPFIATPNVGSLLAGNYTLTVRDSIGCIQDTTFSINEPQDLSVNLLSTKEERCFNLCDGKVSLAATGGSTPYSFYVKGNQFDDTVTASLCSGIYKGFVIDSNLCMDSVDFTINGPSPLIITTNDDSICIGSPSVISANVTGGSLNGGSDYNYLWTNDGSVQGQSLFNIYPSQDTVFNVFALDDSLCSSDTLQLRININPVFDFSATVTSGCPVLTTEFIPQLQNNILISNSFWDFGNGEVSDNYNDNIETYLTDGLYSPSLTLTSDKGCESTITKNDYIEVFVMPTADFIYKPFPENATVLNPDYYFTNTSLDADSYVWDMAGIDTLTEESPSFRFSELTEKSYLITLIANTDNGCADTTSKTVIVENEIFIYVPNTFSPNEDGINDLFKPTSNGITFDSYRFSVFNRWGQEIFTTDLQDHEGWDGTFNDEEIIGDIYIWRLEGITYLEFGTGVESEVVRTGTVSVIK